MYVYAFILKLSRQTVSRRIIAHSTCETLNAYFHICTALMKIKYSKNGS